MSFKVKPGKMFMVYKYECLLVYRFDISICGVGHVCLRRGRVANVHSI